VPSLSRDDSAAAPTDGWPSRSVMRKGGKAGGGAPTAAGGRAVTLDTTMTSLVMGTAREGGGGRGEMGARSCENIYLFSRNFRRSATSFLPTSLEIQNEVSNEVGRNEVGLAIARQIRPVQALDTSYFVTARLRLPNLAPQT